MRIVGRLRGTLWRTVARAGTAIQRAELRPSAVGVAGIEILVDDREPATPAAVAKVGAALALIGEVDPRRFRRLTRDVCAVALVGEPLLGMLNGAYLAGSRTCYVRTALVNGYSAAAAAILLIHEATHARLDGLRTVPWWPPLRYRMEHRCLHEELAFADRLPRDTYPTVDGWCENRRANSRYAPRPPRRGRTVRTGRAA